MIICLGPVCVPVHLLLAFLVGVAHQHGYLQWFKREWVMFSWWRQQFTRLIQGAQEPAANTHGRAASEGTPEGCAAGSACAVDNAGSCGDTAADAGSAGGSDLRSRGTKADAS